MSAPELPPGWDASLDTLDQQLDLDDLYVDQLLQLGGIQQRHIDQLDRRVLDYVYAFARHQLRAKYNLPAGGPYQAMVYQQMSVVQHRAVGAGLQYNVQAGGQPLAVRTQAYRIGEDNPLEPLPPFDNGWAEEIYLLVDGIEKAFKIREGSLLVEYDLTTVVGDPLPSKIVSVAPLSS